MSEHFPLCCVFTSYITHWFLWNYRYRSIINLFLPLHTMIDRCLHLMLHHLDNRCGCMLWFYRTRNEVDKWWRRNDIIIRRRPVGIVFKIKQCGQFSSNTTFLLATMDLGRWVAFPFLLLSISVADFSFYACCCGRRLEEKSGVELKLWTEIWNIAHWQEQVDAAATLLLRCCCRVHPEFFPHHYLAGILLLATPNSAVVLVVCRILLLLGCQFSVQYRCPFDLIWLNSCFLPSAIFGGPSKISFLIPSSFFCHCTMYCRSMS